MKGFLNIGNTRPWERLLFAEPEGDAGAGAGAGAGDKPKAKPAGDGAPATLTQEQVNALMATERRAWEKKLTEERKAREELHGKYEALNGDFGEFKRLLEEAAADEGIDVHGNGSGDPELDALERELAIPPGVKDQQTYKLLKKQQLIAKRQLASVLGTITEQDKTLKDVQKLLADERTARKTAEEERKNAIRERIIIDALTKNRCVDPEVGLKVVKDQISLDDETGQYVYTRKDGMKVSVLEGITAELPKYLIEAQTPSGGSGSSGARGISTDQEIATLEQALSAAEELAKKQPNARNIAGFQTARRKVLEAKKSRQVASAAR